MENTSETITLSNIRSDVCVDSRCTDQKLKLEIDQMISKRKNKSEFVANKQTSKSANYDGYNSNSECSVDDDSIEVLEHMRHRNASSNVSKHLLTSTNNWKNEKKSNKIDHIGKKYDKISQVTRDTRCDVLKILLILQKIIDDSRLQKQKVTKLEIKLKELDEKIHNCSTSETNNKSEHSSTDRNHHGGNFREYELKFDRFKQEVNTEIIKINNALVLSNTNFDNQITSMRSQLATLFSTPKHKTSRCC